MLIQLLALLLFSSTSQAKTFRLAPGQTYDEANVVLKLVFERFHTTKTECAVPGFNCGAGYTPEPVTTPVIKKVWKDKSCEKSPRPKHCELDFQIIGTDSKTYVELKIINPLDRCMEETDKSNRSQSLLVLSKNKNMARKHTDRGSQHLFQPGEAIWPLSLREGKLTLSKKLHSV